MKADIIKTVADDIRSKGFKIIYIGAFGSYNYNLFDQLSDLDLKVVVEVPIERKIFEKSIHSKERHYLYSNAVPKIECYLVTLTEFIYELSVFDVLFLEALFSKYCYISTLFEQYHKNLKGYITTCILANRHRLYSNYLSMAERINKSFANSMFDPNGHKSYHILRFHDFLVKFESEHNYAEAMVVNTPTSSIDFVNRILSHKNNILDSNTIRSDATEYIEMIRTFVMQYSDSNNQELMKSTTTCLIDMCTNIRASIYGVKQEQLISKVYKSMLRKQENATDNKFKYDSRFKLDPTSIAGKLIPFVEHVDVGTDSNEICSNIINSFTKYIGDSDSLSIPLQQNCVERFLEMNKRNDIRQLTLLFLTFIIPIITSLLAYIIMK